MLQRGDLLPQRPPGFSWIILGMLFGLHPVLYFIGQGEGHIQSVVLTAQRLILGTLPTMMGSIADLIASNRKPSGRIFLRAKRIKPGLDSHRKEESMP